MRRILFTILAVLSVVSCNGKPVTDIQVGDIVFIESQSSQSPYIKLGTMSKWTHCGVVVDTPEGLKGLEKIIVYTILIITNILIILIGLFLNKFNYQ